MKPNAATVDHRPTSNGVKWNMPSSPYLSGIFPHMYLFAFEQYRVLVYA